MSIDELKQLKARFENKCFELRAQMLDLASSDERDAISRQISQCLEQIESLDRQIDRLKREQLPASSESLTGLVPPETPSGGSPTYNIFNNAQLGATNFGADNQGAMIGRQENRAASPPGRQDASPPSPPPPTPQEGGDMQDDFDLPAHLLCSVFKSRANPDELIRVVVELHFYDCQKGQVEKERIDPLSDTNAADSGGVEQIYQTASLAHCLSQAVERGVLRLQELQDNQQFQGVCEPVVEVFLPGEWLGSPMKDFCGEFRELPRRYSVVVRASDRWEGVPRDIVYYQSRLAAAWKRFFKVERGEFPNISASPALETLPWLHSRDLDNEDFEDYVGIQCFSQCLTAGSEYWAELIESGMPFALWLYDCDIPCKLPPAERHAIFQRLICGDRFRLLDESRKERRKTKSTHFKANGYHLGVFYEDINYRPTIEPEMSWPSQIA